MPKKQKKKRNAINYLKMYDFYIIEDTQIIRIRSNTKLAQAFKARYIDNDKNVKPIWFRCDISKVFDYVDIKPLDIKRVAKQFGIKPNMKYETVSRKIKAFSKTIAESFIDALSALQ